VKSRFLCCYSRKENCKFQLQVTDRALFGWSEHFPAKEVEKTEEKLVIVNFLAERPVSRLSLVRNDCERHAV